MEQINPFDVINQRLDQLQTTLIIISSKISALTQPPVVDPSQLLNLAEVAKFIGKPVGTIRHYIHDRGLPAVKVGKGYLVKHEELLDWIEQLKKGQQPDPYEKMIHNRKRFSKR